VALSWALESRIAIDRMGEGPTDGKFAFIRNAGVLHARQSARPSQRGLYHPPHELPGVDFVDLPWGWGVGWQASAL